MMKDIVKGVKGYEKFVKAKSEDDKSPILLLNRLEIPTRAIQECKDFRFKHTVDVAYDHIADM